MREDEHADGDFYDRFRNRLMFPIFNDVGEVIAFSGRILNGDSGAAKYIKYLLDRFDNNVEMAVAAYNAGPERVAKEGPRATAEAVDYVAVVTNLYSNALRAL